VSEEARTDWVPRLRDDLVVTELPITDPFDGFILSRIDGESTVKDIADLTGASVDRVQELLSRLEGLGALGRPPGPPARATRPPPVKAEEEAEPEPEADGPPSVVAQPLYDPRELDETADLDPERKHEILHAFHRLQEVDYYQLLGVSREADKKEIRAAYFRLSKRFHPDTLFGKELGSFKTKMEKIFEHLTRAYDTLGKKKRRRSYDEYLAVHDETKAMESSLEEAEADAADVAGSVLPDEDQRRELENAQTDRPPDGKGDISAPKVDAPEIPKAPRPPRLTDEERKAMAKRLMEKRLGKKPSSIPASAPPPKPERPSKQAVLSGLRSSLKVSAQLTGGTAAAQAQRFVEEAETKEEAGNILGAVNALKMALAIVPEREDLVARHDELRAQLAAQMAETYLKQARYEEQHGNWESAARSWQKVAEGRPKDARAWRQAALALMEAGGDLKLARDLAQKAVGLQPKLVSSRVALARVFVRAGMKASAKKELEEAVKLDPEAEIVKTLQRELK
jgi:curved DNA-binding protein CbpA